MSKFTAGEQCNYVTFNKLPSVNKEMCQQRDSYGDNSGISASEIREMEQSKIKMQSYFEEMKNMLQQLLSN